jgi:hypothetical protein
VIQKDHPQSDAAEEIEPHITLDWLQERCGFPFGDSRIWNTHAAPLLIEVPRNGLFEAYDIRSRLDSSF